MFLGLWYGVGLTLVGLDFGFLIGVIGGVLSFIPYVGSLTALVLSLGVALVQGWPQPDLVPVRPRRRRLRTVPRRLRPVAEAGRRVDRPASGLADVRAVRVRRLFGFTGLLVAVPTAAALGVIVRHLIGLYLKSPLYRGESAARGLDRAAAPT